MLQPPFVTFVAICSLFVIGCRSANSDNLPAQSTVPKGTVQIERSSEAEAVLSQLGQKSFVFIHRGGKLTTDFTIYYRPRGKNQTEQVLFHASGNETIAWLRARPDDDGRHGEEGGYAIIAWPENFAPKNGNVTFSFSLDGTGRLSSSPAKEIFPKTLFDKKHQECFEVSSVPNRPVDLRPGETKTVVRYSVRWVPPDLESLPGSDKLPEVERASELETVRFVLTATALKESQPPSRDNPPT